MTVTRGADVYPEPPQFVGIVAIVPAVFDIAVAVVPPVAVASKVILLTSFLATSIVAIAIGVLVQVNHVVFTVTVGLAI